MIASIIYLRDKYPRAEAGVSGGTAELVALGAVGTVAEKWVILSDNGPLAELLGEGTGRSGNAFISASGFRR
jgi:hypothetical protein